MRITNKIFKNSFVLNGIKKLVTIISGLIFLILMTRYLGVELRGEYAVIMNYINICATFLNLGISLVIPSFFRNRKDFTTDDFLSISFYQFIIYLSISLILFLITGNFQLFLIASLTSLSILTMQIGNIGLVINVKHQAISTIMSSIINIIGICALFFYSSSQNLLYVLIVFMLKNLTIVIVNSAYLNFHLMRPKMKWLEIIKLGLLPMIVTGLIALNFQIDVLMLEFKKIDHVMIGLFATGVALAEYSWVIPDVFKEVMLNKNARKDDLFNLNLSLRFAFSFVILFAIIFLIFGKSILYIAFGAEFIPSYWVTLLMFFAVPFMVFVKLIGTLFIAQSKWFLYFRILSLTVFINVILNYFLIDLYGISGAAYASICSYSFCGMSCLIWYSKKYSFPIRDLFIIKSRDIQFITQHFTK